MNFTREDILKIQNALLQLGRKDSEFKEANIPLSSDDYMAILQNGINKKVQRERIVQFEDRTTWKRNTNEDEIKCVQRSTSE